MDQTIERQKIDKRSQNALSEIWWGRKVIYKLHLKDWDTLQLQRLNSTIGTSLLLSYLYPPNQNSRNYFKRVEKGPKWKFIGGSVVE